MVHAISLLGGVKVLGLNPKTPREWIDLVRKGFPPATLASFAAHTGITNIELAGILGISLRALASRRSQEARLSNHESERLLRAARVTARANEVFGNFEKGISWLRAEKKLFGGAAPISLVDTEAGTEWILDFLDRIEHGMFA